MAITPPPPNNNDSRDERDLDEAKKKLSEMHGRPFDVDQVLARHRAKQEHEIEVRHKAQVKVDEIRKDARQRRHEIQTTKAAIENQKTLEKELDFKEKTIVYEKTLVEKQMHEKMERKSSDADKEA